MMKKVITLSLIAMMASTVVAFHNEGSDCARCHIVHMATDNIGVPLWNGAQSITYDAFTDYYDGYDMQADVGASPLGSTLLCLSCHDGGTNHEMTTVQGSMRGTHPIEFVYDSALTALDNELWNPETTTSGVEGSTGTIAADMLMPDTQIMNCVSCHDIHIQGLAGQSVSGSGEVDGTPVDYNFNFDIPHLVNLPGIEYKLRWGGNAAIEADYSLDYSALCTTCHYK